MVGTVQGGRGHSFVEQGLGLSAYCLLSECLWFVVDCFKCRVLEETSVRGLSFVQQGIVLTILFIFIFISIFSV